MFCGNCGKFIPDGMNACPNCHSTVRPNSPVQTPPPPPVYNFNPVNPYNQVPNAVPPVAPQMPVDNKPPKKKKKHTAAFVILTLIFTVVLGVFAFYFIKYTTEVKKVPEPVSAPVGLVNVNSENAQVGDIQEITNDSQSVYDMTFIIGGVKYSLPMKLSDFQADGWIYNDTDYNKKTVPAGETKMIMLHLGEYSIDVTLFNPTSSDLSPEECFIGEISSTWAEFILPKNITTHKSTRADIIEAYGNPDSEYLNIYMYYGYSQNEFAFYEYPMDSTVPAITFKFDEDCYSNGAKDTDVLKYVNIQWYDPDVVTKYNERSGNR